MLDVHWNSVPCAEDPWCPACSELVLDMGLVPILDSNSYRRGDSHNRGHHS